MQIWIGWIKPYHLLTVNNTVYVVAPCKRNLLLFSRVRRRKGTSVWILSSFRRRRRPNIGLVNLVFQCYECEHRFVNKPMVIAEPTVPSVRLLGLGSRLYPSNMPRMRNKDRTRFKQRLSRRATIEQVNARRCSQSDVVHAIFFFFRTKWPTHWHPWDLNPIKWPDLKMSVNPVMHC